MTGDVSKGLDNLCLLTQKLLSQSPKLSVASSMNSGCFDDLEVLPKYLPQSPQVNFDRSLGFSTGCRFFLGLSINSFSGVLHCGQRLPLVVFFSTKDSLFAHNHRLLQEVQIDRKSECRGQI